LWKLVFCDMMSQSRGSVGPVMTPDEPSLTAFTAAAARAAHRMVDGPPRIFDDELAETMLGDRAAELLSYHQLHGDHPILAGARAQVICRARLAEERAAHADQYILLGAGLDTYAYRTTLHTRVFEVDHPATQRWKRQRLAEAGIAEPETVVYVPLDFEAERLDSALRQAGLDPDSPAVVAWLGVVMYLTQPAIERTLAALATLAPGSELVVDYMVPEELRDDDGRLYAAQVAKMTAEQGEPWRSVFTPAQLSSLLETYGWSNIVHIGQHDVPELADRADALRPSTLARIAHARR